VVTTRPAGARTVSRTPVVPAVRRRGPGSAVAILACIGLVFGAGAAASRWLGGEEARIGRRLEAMAGVFNRVNDQSGLRRLATAAELGRYFSEDVNVSIGPRRIAGREHLVAAVVQIDAGVSDLRISLGNLDLELSPDGLTATAACTIRASGRVRATDERWREMAELEFDLRKAPHGWEVATVRSASAIESPLGGTAGTRR
jgi:hypothetical protein